MESLYKRRWRDSNQIIETNSQLSFYVGEVIAVRQLPVYETSSVGLTVWDSSFVLMKYLERNVERFRGKKAIELGSGTGIVGLALSSLGTNVLITEYNSSELMSNLHYNLNLNPKIKNASISFLNWGEQNPHIKGPFDIVIACDVFYETNIVKPFLSSLLSLSNSDTLIFIAYELHSPPSVQLFYEIAQQHFSISKVPESELDNVFQSPDIVLLELKKVSNATSLGSDIFDESSEDIKINFFIEAVKRGNLVQVEEIVQNAIDKNILFAQVDTSGNSALHCAVSSGRTEIVKYLIQNGCNVNSINKNGDTALHLASWKGNEIICRLLVAMGADRLLRNAQNKTPLDLASLIPIKAITTPLIEEDYNIDDYSDEDSDD